MATKTWLGDDSGNEGDLNVAANWSPSGVPTGSDTIVFDGSRSNEDVDTSLTTFAAVALADVIFMANFTGLVGTADTPMSLHGSSSSHVIVGSPSPISSEDIGSDRINLDFSATFDGSVTVLQTSNASEDQGSAPVTLQGGHSSNGFDLNVQGGVVGVGTKYYGDAAELDDVVVDNGAVLTIGSAVTFQGDVDVVSGRVVNQGSAMNNVEVGAGARYETLNAGTHTSIHVKDGGVLDHRSDGTVTTLEVYGTAILDKDNRAKTLTNLKIGRGGDVRMAVDNLTLTNDVVLIDCGLQDVSIETKIDVTITVA